MLNYNEKIGKERQDGRSNEKKLIGLLCRNNWCNAWLILFKEFWYIEKWLIREYVNASRDKLYETAKGRNVTKK